MLRFAILALLPTLCLAQNHLKNFDREYDRLRNLPAARRSQPPRDYIKEELEIEAIKQKIVWGAPIVFVGLIVLAWLLAGRPDVSPPAPPKETVSDNYGTASYYIQLLQMPGPYHFMQGVFFGKSSTPGLKNVPLAQNCGAPIYSWPESHTIIIARTRTGKGTRIVIPTLARYFGSMLVIDPKGENAPSRKETLCDFRTYDWFFDEIDIDAELAFFGHGKQGRAAPAIPIKQFPTILLWTGGRVFPYPLFTLRANRLNWICAFVK